MSWNLPRCANVEHSEEGLHIVLRAIVSQLLPQRVGHLDIS